MSKLEFGQHQCRTNNSNPIVLYNSEQERSLVWNGYVWLKANLKVSLQISWY